MMLNRTLLLFAVLAGLGGCASKGCSGASCDRPDSSDRQLVIWWSDDMRQGIDDRDHKQDYTVVPLKD